VRALLLGFSALLVHKGLTESLARRFFLRRCLHWSWLECREAFGWPLERWIYFGGQPGAASLIRDEAAWKRYINDSLIETVIARGGKAGGIDAFRRRHPAANSWLVARPGSRW
jgi:hypothetical protein